MPRGRGERGPDWVRLLEGWAGPLIRVRLTSPPEAARPLVTLDVTGLLDTGATTTLVDRARVVEPFGLPILDREILHVAGRDRAAVHVFELGIDFPDFAFPLRRRRVGAMALPPPFAVLIGMDLLRGTRMAIEWDDDGRYLAWEALRG